MIQFIAARSSTALEVLGSFHGDEQGQDMMEYGLMAALLSVACIAAIVLLGPQISLAFNHISSTLQATFP